MNSPWPFESPVQVPLYLTRSITNTFPAGISPPSKYAVAGGPGSIDESLAVAGELLGTGGYIPYVDHSVPPQVSWGDFRYYREKLNSLLDRGRK